MLFGIYPDYNGHPLSRVENILYEATSKSIWAVALGFIIFSCAMDKGGNDLFGYKNNFEKNIYS